MRDGEVDRSQVRQGRETREQRRRQATKSRITIRIDAEIIEEFKKMASEGCGYQSMINLALREWLAAQGVKELLSDKISEVVDQAVVSIQSAAQSVK